MSVGRRIEKRLHDCDRDHWIEVQITALEAQPELLAIGIVSESGEDG